MPPSEHELRLRERLGRLRNMPLLGGAKLSGDLQRFQKQLDRLQQEATDEEIWRSVQLARHDNRPYTLDYVERLLADRHGFPVLSLVDTPGAYPGVAAEQHGQGGTIASSQAVMARLNVPTVACVIGEGGSGGAIAIALADRVLMQENAIYSVISPEGCAMILWRDAGEAKKAAAAFKPDAAHCLELGVIDGIVPEPPGGAHIDPDMAARLLGQALRGALAELDGISGDDLRRRRRARFRSLGVFG